MDPRQHDVSLYVDTADDRRPRIRNAAPTTNTEGLNLFKLSDLSRNNLSFDLLNVTVLEISKCDIGAIPNTIKKLNLQELILTHNKLKEAPSCLYSGLKTLQLLDLSHNLLTDFQVEPACSANIIKLNISHNRIRDFPIWVLTARCPKLQEVYYSNNCIVNLNTCRELFVKKLEMRNCQMMDIDFRFLKRIRTLESLDIGNDESGKNENKFKEISELFNNPKWRNFHTLKLNNLTLSVIPREIFYLTYIKELHLVNCFLNWISEDIQYLKNLEILDVSENSICALPTNLSMLEKLKIVKAASNVIYSVPNFFGPIYILDLYSNQLENFAFDIERIDLIDLEKNPLNTLLLKRSESYQKKKDAYRARFNLNRTNGPEEVQQTPEPSDDEGGNLSDEVIEHTEISNNYYDVDAEDECWDEVKVVQVTPEKNPDVTPSDEEWIADEIIQRKKPKKNIIEFDPDEDWIFADVEEH